MPEQISVSFDARSSSLAAVLGALLTGVIVVSPATADASRMTYSGSIGVYVDGRRGHNSSSTRQDWDLTTDLSFEGQETRRHRGDGAWSFALSGRLTSDLDGRRLAEEPGIYNGIQETFKGNVQPFLHRAYINRAIGRSIGVFEDVNIRLGRQQRSEGDMLWFDGGEVTALVGEGDREIGLGVFGGVPVRLYESATGDWLAGGALRGRVGTLRLGLEAYHIEEDARFFVTRRDNVGRVSAWAPIESLNADLYGTVRVIEDDGADGQLRATWRPGDKGFILRGDYRFQTEARGAQATEIDLASIIMGRSIGAPRTAFNEFAGSFAAPLGEKLSVEIGGSTRDAEGAADRLNFDFDRYFATLGLTGLKLADRDLELSVTGEAYETPSDRIRTGSGEARLHVTEKFLVSAGTTFALYSYDYSTGAVRDNVRIGSLRAEYRATEKCRLEARYDAEDDDQRLHHYVRLGARYAF